MRRMGISAVEALRYHTSLISLSNPSSLDFSIMKHPLCSKALPLPSFLGAPSAGSGGVGPLISVAFVVALLGLRNSHMTTSFSSAGVSIDLDGTWGRDLTVCIRMLP